MLALGVFSSSCRGASATPSRSRRPSPPPGSRPRSPSSPSPWTRPTKRSPTCTQRRSRSRTCSRTSSKGVLIVAIAAMATLGALVVGLRNYESFLLLLGSCFVPLFRVLLADWLRARPHTRHSIFDAPAWRPELLLAWIHSALRSTTGCTAATRSVVVGGRRRGRASRTSESAPPSPASRHRSCSLSGSAPSALGCLNLFPSGKDRTHSSRGRGHFLRRSESLPRWDAGRHRPHAGCTGRRVHGSRCASGCGKTTALRMVAGLEEISEARSESATRS